MINALARFGKNFKGSEPDTNFRGDDQLATKPSYQFGDIAKSTGDDTRAAAWDLIENAGGGFSSMLPDWMQGPVTNAVSWPLDMAAGGLVGTAGLIEGGAGFLGDVAALPFGEHYGRKVAGDVLGGLEVSGVGPESRMLGLLAEFARPQVAKKAGEATDAAKAEIARFKADQEGAFLGINSPGTNTTRLAEARALRKSGATPEKIWAETGFVRGADGHWRWEISDTDAALTGKTSGQLSDVLDHPELFKNADMSGITAEIGSTGKFRGYFAGRADGTGKIATSSKLSADERLNNITHEIQHELDTQAATQLVASRKKKMKIKNKNDSTSLERWEMLRHHWGHFDWRVFMTQLRR